VTQSLLEVRSNIRSVYFSDLQPLSSRINRKFSRLECFSQTEYFSKDILFPRYLRLVNKSTFLLNLSSLNLKLKFIMEANV
jgi:trehalose-6-phosphate synthase